MTLSVSAAFDLWRRSKNGGLSIVIGAVSFCKAPSSGEMQPHVRVASNWQIEVPNSAEKLKLLVGSRMPDKWIIDRGFIRRDIA